MKNNFAIIKVFNDADLNFEGNTAAVVFTERQLTPDLMQNIASDFNQPATSFLWTSKNENVFGAAWFAPDAQIDLCGHGSLAQAAWIGENFHLRKFKLETENTSITASFNQNNEAEIELEIIGIQEKLTVPEELEKALGERILEYYSSSNKYLVLLEKEEAVKGMKVNFNALRKLQPFGYTVTAKGNSVDFVSRTLVPKVQQLEDHATGSSHAVLAPFWSRRLNKNKMTAHQLSKRGGKFICSLDGNLVKLKGNYRILASGHCHI